MTIWIYGDVTLDNYEYEYPGDVSKVYANALSVDSGQFPRLTRPLRNRFVARQFGGAYLLARQIAVALALWNSARADTGGHMDPSAAAARLNALAPWSGYRRILRTMEEQLAKNPSQFSDVLQLFYRISEDSDHCYRVRPEGQEGFTLPSRRYTGRDLFRCLIGGPHSPEETQEHKGAPIVLDELCHTATLCVFNDGGTRLWRENTDWLHAEPWANEPNHCRPWAVIKSDDFHTIAAHNSPSTVPAPSLLRKLMQLLPDRVVLVVGADDLRHNGVAVSRSLSWERCVTDLVSEIEGKNARDMDLPSHLVVIFDFDAALYLRTSVLSNKVAVDKATLVLSTNRSEGEYRSQFQGAMPGAQSLFLGVLASLMYSHCAGGKCENIENILDCNPLVEKLLTYGLITQQRMLQSGFLPLSEDNLFRRSPESGDDHGVVSLIPRLLYHDAVFALPPIEPPTPPPPDEAIPTAVMPTAARPDAFSYPLGRDVDILDVQQLKKDQSAYELAGVLLDRAYLMKDGWEILDVLLDRLPQTAEPFVEYVEKGKVTMGGAAIALPICNIGKIKTISSVEIASLRSVRRLVHSYLERSDGRQTPLGLAVFGAPGSGKSFAVKSVFETLRGHAKALIDGAMIECNLSGLNEAAELAGFFETARDLRLIGKVPVLFFDEFDCAMGEAEYFWLKHFLAPLQDGVFSTERTTHPIGKSIMVFAGSKELSFNCFKRKCAEGGSAVAGAKGKDFVSRLHGHLDVEGLWPAAEGDDGKSTCGGDYFAHPESRKYAIKRAILLRDILKLRVPALLRKTGSEERINIDGKVVEAFLREESYLHGVRSLEAVVRMSAIDRITRFTPECLPTREQLEMHVSSAFYDRAFGRRQMGRVSSERLVP